MKLAIAGAIVSALTLTDASDYEKHKVLQPHYSFSESFMMNAPTIMMEVEGCTIRLQNMHKVYQDSYDDYFYTEVNLWYNQSFDTCKWEDIIPTDRCWHDYLDIRDKMVKDFMTSLTYLPDIKCFNAPEQTDVYVFKGMGQLSLIENVKIFKHNLN